MIFRWNVLDIDIQIIIYAVFELNLILWFAVLAPLIGALMIFYKMGFNSKLVLVFFRRLEREDKRRKCLREITALVVGCKMIFLKISKHFASSTSLVGANLRVCPFLYFTSAKNACLS
jgi:hypothetical protein